MAIISRRQYLVKGMQEQREEIMRLKQVIQELKKPIKKTRPATSGTNNCTQPRLDDAMNPNAYWKYGSMAAITRRVTEGNEHLLFKMLQNFC